MRFISLICIIVGKDIRKLENSQVFFDNLLTGSKGDSYEKNFNILITFRNYILELF